VRRGRPWTERDLRILRARYGAHGATALARVLDRSPGSVRSKASALGLQYGAISTGISIADVASAAGVSRTSARKAARRADVLRSMGDALRAVHVVPEEWAEEYIASVEARRAARPLLDHHYDVTKVASLFGVTTDTLYRWLKGVGVGASVLENVRRHRAPGDTGGKWLFNPYDIELALREYRRRQ
jgi:transposase-like protein